MNNYKLRKGTLFLFFLVCFFLTGTTVLAVDQVKTTEFYVYDSPDSFSSSLPPQEFQVYIGDNLSGVSNPVKSAYFIASGFYTGDNGTLNLTLNSANSKTFTLPSVGSAATYFELLYKDDASIINPVSGGEYSYTLGINPSGIIIYGFGVKLSLTFRYVPAACPDGSNQKIKNSVFYVYDSPDSFSNSLPPQEFQVYIGDNISGISSPVKSAYFTVSGVYTGGGTLNLTLNSGNSKTYNLPSVSSTPTFFELLYKDTSSIINPSSAGTYTYALGINPSGVTIYGLGVKLHLIHRYVPPSCGGVATGELTSAVFDTTEISDGPAYNSILWKGTVGSGKVRLKIATSDSPSGPWQFRGPDPGCSLLTASDSDWYVASPDTPLEIGCVSHHNNKRYFKYKIQLCMASDCTSTGATSPNVTDVIVNWSP